MRTPAAALAVLALLAAPGLTGCPSDDDGPGRFTSGDPPADDDDGSDDDDATPPPEDADDDGYPADVDCDDDDPLVWPGAPELCDDLDNDCDDQVDEEPLADLNWYRDADGDGFGSPDDVVTGCEPLDGYVLVGGDCDDDNPSVHPAALVDGVDADCDGRTEWLLTVTITVVAAYWLCVDHEDNTVGWNQTWDNAETYSVWLDSGEHVVGFEGVGVKYDDPDYELTGALAFLSISNGTEWWTNSLWRYDPDPLADADTRTGWCSPGFDDSEWAAAAEFAQWGAYPWDDNPPELEGTPAVWIWDDVPLEHTTQYFRLEIELP